jgi:transposase-like protein
MKYTKEQRLDISRRIYDGEISKYEAAEQYDISYQTARDYMRLYRETSGDRHQLGHQLVSVE